MEETKYTTCPLCEATCGLEIRLEDNKIKKIVGDKADPFSQGYICPKAPALEELQNDPDRLVEPVKRTDKGWIKIPWDEAFDEVAHEFQACQKKYGKNALGVYLGNPLGHSTDGTLYLEPLLSTLKTKNSYSSASLDQAPHMLASYFMFGHMALFTIPDVDRTMHMVIIGANPLVSNGSVMTAPNIRKRLRGIKERGGQIVVIDPRKTETAAEADLHHFIRPGTDALFLLAFLNVLFRENLARPGRLAEFTNGIEELRAIAEKYPPARVAEITGIAAADIESLVRNFARAESAVMYPRIGTSVQEFGGLCHWLIHAIHIVTGNLDKPGGMMFTKPALDLVGIAGLMNATGSYDRYRSRVSQMPELRGEFPCAALIEEIETPGEGQIKSMLTISGNPVLSSPNGRRLDHALAGLDFMASIDIYINETTRHANIILPSRPPLERHHIEVLYQMLSVRNKVKYSPAVLQPAAKSKGDAEIFSALMARMDPAGLGFINSLFSRFMKPTDLIDAVIRMGPHGDKFMPFSNGLNLKKIQRHNHGIDLGPMEPQLPKRLFTRDKKIQLVPEVFSKDLARLDARLAHNRDTKKFILIGRRELRSNNSWMHNYPKLTRGEHSCFLLIHPEDATRLKITEHQTVKLTSRAGALHVTAQFDETMMRGVVSMPHGWGHDRKNARLGVASSIAGVSINDITEEKFMDVLVGTSALNGTEVDLEAVGS